MHLIGGLAFIFVGLTVINRVLEGQIIASADIDIINTLTIVRIQSFLGGWLKLPVLNLSFFTEGIPHLVMWDYSFFGGNAAIFMFFLYSLTAAVSFLIFTVIIVVFVQRIGRLL